MHGLAMTYQHLILEKLPMVEIQLANQIRRHLHEGKIREGRPITNHQRKIARKMIAGSLRGWREESP
jgi:hypothetical protein